MPSQALLDWRSIRSAALDELERAHQGVGGRRRGRRHATQQINHAYTVMISSQFQGFCRDLHTESANALLLGGTLLPLKTAFSELLLQDRKLDKANPNPGNIGFDFNPFGLVFWNEVRSFDSRNGPRQRQLEDLVTWRNAIAHQDFSKISGGPKLHLSRVRAWRAACDHLATAFDAVMWQHIKVLVGVAPWPI
jgi:hypothetical protein